MRSSALLPAALVALATLVAPSLAHADEREPRSPTTATYLALAPLGATVALTATAAATDNDTLKWVALGTFVFGPSLGHYYAGAPDRGIAATLGRAGGLGIMMIGGVLSVGASWSDGSGGGPGSLLLVAGLGTVVAATAFDVIDAAPAARRYNQRLTIAPTMVSGAAGTAPGMALSGRF